MKFSGEGVEHAIEVDRERCARLLMEDMQIHSALARIQHDN